MAILIDILQESKKEYRKMLAPLGGMNNFSFVRNTVKEIQESLKRSDRIIWFLRFFRLEVIPLLSDEILSQLGEEEYNRLLNWREKEKAKLEQKIGGEVSELEVLHRQFIQELGHFISLADMVPEINSYVFNNQTPSEVYNDLREIEERWQEEQKEKNNILQKKEEHSILISFPDGSAWFNLNTASCSDEAEAMGHCGNEYNPNYEDTILSFRTPKNGGWVPHLTFILSEHGYLGEMKGRANEKPSKKYHPYIIALLKSKAINGIRGGGYAPENNFSIFDLEENTVKQLLDMKPQLATIREVIKNYGLSPSLMKRVEDDCNDIFKFDIIHKKMAEEGRLHGDGSTLYLYNENYDLEDFTRENEYSIPVLSDIFFYACQNTRVFLEEYLSPFIEDGLSFSNFLYENATEEDKFRLNRKYNLFNEEELSVKDISDLIIKLKKTNDEEYKKLEKVFIFSHIKETVKNIKDYVINYLETDVSGFRTYGLYGGDEDFRSPFIHISITPNENNIEGSEVLLSIGLSELISLIESGTFEQFYEESNFWSSVFDNTDMEDVGFDNIMDECVEMDKNAFWETFRSKFY
jgi:hypothetical protein